MIRVGIIGVSGYSGELLLKVLLAHPKVRVTYTSAHSTHGPLGEIIPSLRHKTQLTCELFKPEEAIKSADLFFLAVPHTGAMSIAPALLKTGKKVIDLSADYRLNSSKIYTQWYQHEHTDPKNLAKAVYGLPEFYRNKITKAQLIANPGCYPTAAILSLAPIIVSHSRSIRSICIDAKSGVSGAGRKISSDLMFVEVNASLKAYKVLTHQHTPEIEQYLSRLSGKPVSVSFIPHLIPINRGILETAYVHLDTAISAAQVAALYQKFYKKEPFVRILPPGKYPEIKDVAHTNFCDIGFAVDPKKRLLVIISAIDNLMKGASGQAVQNMNIMSGYPETDGLLA